VGAGVGLSLQQDGRRLFTGNPALLNVIDGDSRWSLAWSLMAGVGYQISDRVTSISATATSTWATAESGTIDNAGIRTEGAHRRHRRARVQGRPALRLRRRRALLLHEVTRRPPSPAIESPAPRRAFLIFGAPARGQTPSALR